VAKGKMIVRKAGREVEALESNRKFYAMLLTYSGI
jgi:hypothetical protein